MKKNQLLTLSALFLMASCKPFDPTPGGLDETPVEEKTMSELLVPNGFLYETSETVSIRISAVDNDKNLMSRIPFTVFFMASEADTPALLFSGQTNDAGLYETALNIPLGSFKLIVETSYPGLPSQEVALSGQNNLSIVLGEGNQVDDRSGYAIIQPEQYSPLSAQDRSTFSYLGTYSGEGVPYYLMAQGDYVSQDILNMIAASLPENQPVPTVHPEYIASSVQTNTVLDADAEIWVTFVHEGAGYRNSLGYYSYPTGQTPQSAAKVGSLKVIFPNVSFSGSGGGLHTGDKVYLGVFPAGTTIGWFVVPDGWQGGSQNVSDANHPIHYSNKGLNTFTQAAYQSHVVQLADPNRELFLLGFEDIDRPGGDNDFNDAIFYVTATPFTAVNRNGMEETNITGNDADGDGVPDNTDAAPNNPEWSFVNFTPSASATGTLAFEDFFPTKGDYDMNDLVLDYQMEEHTDAAGKIVEIIAHLTLRAMGAGFRNGFGFELPIPASSVASITGSNISENFIRRNANGTESDQSNAVIIVFDNGYNLMSNTGGGGYVNTEKERPAVTNKALNITIKMVAPVSRTLLGTAPYNPFLFANQDRGKEIHLPGKSPTDLAEMTLFGTGDDDTNFALGKTYLTANNLPWALNLPVSFAYPKEKSPINTAFLKFNQWAQSAGGSFQDWYKNNAGYRNPEKLY